MATQSPILLAYATNKGLWELNETDARMLTHINLAFGVIRDGLLDMHGLPDIRLIERARAWNPAIRIVLSVGGWGAGGFSTMAMTRAGREAFARSVKDVACQYALDGVDIDWEYPCNGSAGIDHDSRDKETFTLLLQALRDALGDKIVSIAAGAGAYFIRDTEMAAVARILDYVQIMTYDIRSGGCREAGHHTSLYPILDDPRGLSTDSSVKMYAEAGVPPDKIVIGAAFYSRRWRGVPAINNGLLQIAETDTLFGPGYAELTRAYIDKNGWTRYWDADAKAPYLFNGDELISYDDPLSLAHKCAYLKQQGLAGIMYWEHSCDDTHTLLPALYEGLKKA